MAVERCDQEIFLVLVWFSPGASLDSEPEQASQDVGFPSANVSFNSKVTPLSSAELCWV